MKTYVRDVFYDIEIVGEGFPILLLHGFTGNKNQWKPIVKKSLMGFKIILIDLLGHGQSAQPERFERYSMEEVCKDLNEILNVYSLNKVHLLGYSMGGRVALSFVQFFHERVLTLTLESSSPGLMTEFEREARVVNDDELAQFILNEGLESFVDYWGNIPLFQSLKRLPESIQQMLKEERLKNDPKGLAASLRGMSTGRQPSWWDQLENVNVPVHLISGKLDEKFCLIHEQMKKKFPDVKNTNIKDAGHAIHVERPEIFGKIVRGFYLHH
ncbi:2-succinyl-6-hydroxy-2,4-cyclohexadiene-1-carboxylate synthase [Bacillus carboniphilus]|uniref:Putative 2-succinyl-6-hydroxy-2,4-cyclohexadiene-1-carboxylate synthase n=1 Tax=Bacillus carboniphilus TaxID=86663 RepID=A0ABY9JP59_9BACI|nr:2-succinyl-6-hydroxy-2,4-cyclohexadiene-1-carboxylate synthase [Bacillus carboniphilus]WLR41199.1 2-succinyl-6-hydroxy-2,4-cyclohexadiene-1-carboxylate synthase [Bacillus carboniphilus]